MPFAFKTQPVKTLYLLAAVVSILFVRLPVWIISASIPSLRPKRNWTMLRSLGFRVVKTALEMYYEIGLPPPHSNPEVDASKPAETGFAWVYPIPSDAIVGEVAEMARVNNVQPARVFGYWYGARDETGKPGQRAAKGERVLYYFHGGGYVMGSAHPGDMYSNIPIGILQKSEAVFERAFALEYRPASSSPYNTANPYPAQLIDALSGYRYLVETLGFEPCNIIVSGDSSGGHLAFNLVRYLLLANSPTLRPPPGLLLLSPTMDWANTHAGTPEWTMDANEATDYVRVILTNGYSPTSLRGNLDAGELETNAWLSPGSLKLRSEGLYANFPHTLIISGGAEQTVDGMRTIRERLTVDNGVAKIQYIEYPDAFHDFFVFPWHEPERSQGLREVSGWLEKVFQI